MHHVRVRTLLDARSAFAHASCLVVQIQSLNARLFFQIQSLNARLFFDQRLVAYSRFHPAWSGLRHGDGARLFFDQRLVASRFHPAWSGRRHGDGPRHDAKYPDTLTYGGRAPAGLARSGPGTRGG
eukprot:6385206-Prymnesium_polylepis.1